MSVQNLIFATTLLASSSILTVAAMPSLQDSSVVLINSEVFLDLTILLHNLTVGERVSGDKLTQNFSVEVPPNSSSNSMLYKRFKVPEGETITHVQVVNLQQEPNTSYVVHLFGGPGTRAIRLLFVSKVGGGINFVVKIYSI